jgi:hypothetical protein
MCATHVDGDKCSLHILVGRPGGNRILENIGVDSRIKLKRISNK